MEFLVNTAAWERQLSYVPVVGDRFSTRACPYCQPQPLQNKSFRKKFLALTLRLLLHCTTRTLNPNHS